MGIMDGMVVVYFVFILDPRKVELSWLCILSQTTVALTDSIAEHRMEQS